ncbi:MAG: GldG family protein [Syntrophobacteraceae bacterium]
MPSVNRYRRGWAYGSNAVISTVVFLGILIFVVLIAQRHPMRLDLTETGKYSLSPETMEILASIKEPIHIKAFYSSAGQEQTLAKDLLETYSYKNKNITFEFIDPDREPETARSYDVRTYGTLALEGYGKKQSIQSDDEESVTNAILKLTRKDDKKVYFLIGHGEHSLKDFGKDGYSNVKAAIERENYKVEECNLMQNSSVPKDASVLVIAGPEKPLLKEEIASLKAYIEGGGKLLVLLEPFHDGGLRDFLHGYDLELRDDIVIDKLSRVFGGSYLMPVVTQYGPGKITENFNVATFFPEARSIRVLDDKIPGVHAEGIAFTSKDSWAETNLELFHQGQANFDEKEDLPGPITLAAQVTVDVKDSKIKAIDKKPNAPDAPADAAAPVTEGKPAADAAKNEAKDDGKVDAKNDAKAHLVVFGDSSFADNADSELSGNADLFLNSVNFLANEETLVSIKARDAKGKPMLLTQLQARAIFLTSMVFAPLLVLAAGFLVYRARRSQR